MTNSDEQQHQAPPGDKLFWVTRRAAMRVVVAVHIVALLTVLVEWVYPMHLDHHPLERVPELEFLGSYALYGFIGCVLLVLVGKVLRRLVMRPEDYYGGDG